MNDGSPLSVAGASAPRPLQLPETLWNGLSEQEQETYVLAQAILEHMLDLRSGRRSQWPGDSIKGGPRWAAAVGLLDRFGLVSVEQDGGKVRLGLLATPEEHIRVPSPSGGHRWVFIARPIQEPEVEASQLN